MTDQRHRESFFRVHRALTSCASEARYAADQRGLFQSVCDILVRSGTFPLVWFGYAASGGRIAEPAACSADTDGFLEDLKIALRHDGYEDPANICLRTGEPCWIRELSNHTDLDVIRPAIRRCGFTSVISVPVFSDRGPLGALTLYYRDPEEYGEGVISALKEKLPHIQAVFVGSASGPRTRSEEFEAELRDLVDALPVTVGLTDANGMLLHLNRRIIDFTGYTVEDHRLRAAATKYIHPDDFERVYLAYSSGFAAGAPFHHEERILGREDQQYRWFLVHTAPIRDDRGEIIRWCTAGIDIEERKKAEEELRESEKEARQLLIENATLISDLQREGQNFRLIVDTVPGFLCTMTAQGQIEFVNQGILDYTGWTIEQLADWRPLLHPEEREMVVARWTRSVETGEPYDVEHRILGADGVYRFFMVRGMPARDAEGRIVRWYILITDIDERKKTHEKLERSEAFLAQGQQISQTGSFGWSAAGTDVYWSEETYNIMECDRSVKPTMDLVFRFVHPGDRDFVRRTLEHATAEKADFDIEHRLLMPDGRVKNVRVIARAVNTGDLDFVGAVTDITAAKQAEEKIRQSEREARQLVDLSPLHITLLGAEGARLYTNRASLDYYGITLDEWQNADLRQLLHSQDAAFVIEDLPGKLRSGLPFEYEARLKRKDGQFRWFHYRLSPMSDEQGNTTRWYAAGTDIDGRKRAEQRLQEENVALREEIDKTSMFEEIVGTSAPLKKVLSRISKVAPTDSSVLVTGETGTGKELVARAIHARSRRSSYPFVSVNCAAIPHDLIASELFGHEKGAFTGATQRRVGRFELAEKGTIFLDEVGELPAETQIALLRVLQEREFERIGGSGRLQADVRVIAATNRDLESAIESGRFRSDLFYRLNVFPVEVPPLRKRKEDIPLLVTYFLNRYARKAGRQFTAIDKTSLDLLQSYAWPGNIRELQNVIERSVIVSDSQTFSVDESWLSRRPAPVDPAVQPSLYSRPAAEEKALIEAALRECRGRVYGPSGAAARLGIPRTTLESKIRALKINKNRFRTPDAFNEN